MDRDTSTSTTHLLHHRSDTSRRRWKDSPPKAARRARTPNTPKQEQADAPSSSRIRPPSAGPDLIVVGMAYASRPDDFPVADFDGFPAPVRAALRRRGRAVAALRVYERRGWNTSGVRAECARASLELTQLLDELAFAEENPALF